MKRKEFEAALGADLLAGRELFFDGSPTYPNHYQYDLRDAIDPRLADSGAPGELVVRETHHRTLVGHVLEAVRDETILIGYYGRRPFSA